jgi:ACDE family multidrug resistance protein
VGALVLFALDLAVMAVWTDSRAVLVVGIVVAGAFMGVNNTLITQSVMGVAPVERGVASAAYSFVRFSGGAFAPWLAGRLGEQVNVHAPFWMGAIAVAVGTTVLLAFRDAVRPAEQVVGHGETVDDAELVAVGDLD